jgi:putative two-component system response regulator
MTSKILLVDDEAQIRDVLSCMLMELGYDVQAAAGPDEAISLVAREPFHMAFVDNLLGPMLGVDLVEQLARIDPGLHCVIMTGNPNIETAIRSLKNGVSDFLRKPFRTEDLLVSISHVNKKRELEQQRKDLMSCLELKVKEKTDELKQVYLSVLVALSRTVETKDLGTYGHSMRVSHMSGLIAEHLGLSPVEIEDVRAASLLHDIGKIGISDNILGKLGPLTPEEMAIMRQHPEKGAEILQPLKQFESLLPTILHHHERYDGSGYPRGLSGDAIPLLARIISVADTYDAIMSDRPYRQASGHEKALRELRDWSGRQFDPALIDAFIAVINNRDAA